MNQLVRFLSESVGGVGGSIASQKSKAGYEKDNFTKSNKFPVRMILQSSSLCHLGIADREKSMDFLGALA